MLEVKEFVASNGKTYYLHHFPAIPPGGSIYNRMTAINGDPEKRDDFTLRIMKYVGVKVDKDNPNFEMMLDTATVINNHVPDVKVLMEIENALLAWNFDFLAPGEISSYLNLQEKVADNSQNTEMWTDFLRALLTAEEQPSTNSKRSTRSKTHTTSGKA